MVEYGIWSDLAGGLIDAQMPKGEAEAERLRLVTGGGEDADDLKVVELCEQHEEQTKDGCEDCTAEWDLGNLLGVHDGYGEAEDA